ncbi:MAG: hypothetical protein ACKPKO_36400, partial [Candidatus Fonsibacter sp.]
RTGNSLKSRSNEQGRLSCETGDSAIEAWNALVLFLSSGAELYPWQPHVITEDPQSTSKSRHMTDFSLNV